MLSQGNKKFIAILMFMHFGFTMYCISLYELYYEREVQTTAYIQKLNQKQKLIKKLSENYNTNLDFRKIEYNYSYKGK